MSLLFRTWPNGKAGAGAAWLEVNAGTAPSREADDLTWLIGIVQAGTAEQVRDLTKRLCMECGKGGGYIMSVGVGEMKGCRPDLVKVWVESTNEYGVY